MAVEAPGPNIPDLGAIPDLGDVPAAALAIAWGDCFELGESGYLIADGPAPASVVSEGFFDQENIFGVGIFQPLLVLHPTLMNELTTRLKIASRVQLVTSNFIVDHSLILLFLRLRIDDSVKQIHFSFWLPAAYQSLFPLANCLLDTLHSPY